MAGQLSHFVNYAPHIEPKLDHSYGRNRYTNEFDHQFEVMERQLSKTEWLGGDTFSIADIISWPWMLSYKKFKINMLAYPHVRKWFLKIKERPGTKEGMSYGLESARKTLGKGQLMSREDKERLFKQGGKNVQKSNL